MTTVIPLTVSSWVLFVGTNLHVNHERVGEDGLHLVKPHERKSTMTKFKLLAVATVLSAMIATPGIAQQAVQEPGLQAFYQSWGVGSRGAPARAAAWARSDSFASEPLKRMAPRRHARAHNL